MKLLTENTIHYFKTENIHAPKSHNSKLSSNLNVILALLHTIHIQHLPILTSQTLRFEVLYLYTIKHIPYYRQAAMPRY